MEEGSWLGAVPMLAFAAGALALVAVAVKPRTFWAIVILANMVGNGPRINGYLLLDEIVTAGAVGGALAHIAVSRGRLGPAFRRGVHEVVFVLWAGYMVLQSLVGMMVTGDLRIARWVLFYVMIGAALTVTARSREFPFLPARETWVLVLGGAGLAYASWVVQGAYHEWVLDLGIWGRFDSQDTFWSGGAYAAFPLVLGAPAAMVLMTDRSRPVRWLSFGSLVLFMAAGFYFLSRITWVVTLAFLGANLRHVGGRRIATAGLAFIALFLAVGPAAVEDVGPFFLELLESAQVFSDPGESDVTRNLQIRAALATLDDDWAMAVTGSGVYTHRFRIAPHMRKLQDQYLSEEYVKTSLLGRGGTPIDTNIEAIYRTTGFGALLIDAGAIGMGLFLANILLTGWELVRGRSPHWRVLLLTLPILVMWLFVSNTADILLQYLMIMPRGLLDRLGGADLAEGGTGHSEAAQRQTVLDGLAAPTRP